MYCAHCGCGVEEKEVVWNGDMPAQPFHEECYEKRYCDCGKRSLDESGLCIDCLSAAEVAAERLNENMLEAMWEDQMHEELGGAK